VRPKDSDEDIFSRHKGRSRFLVRQALRPKSTCVLRLVRGIALHSTLDQEFESYYPLTSLDGLLVVEFLEARPRSVHIQDHLLV